MKIQSMICDLERRVGVLMGYPTIPGTSLSRVQVDRKSALREGINLPDGKESMFLWCLGLGPAHMPKAFFYGLTIMQAIRTAEKSLIEAEKPSE